MIEKIQLLDRTVDTIRQSIVNKNVPLEKSDGFKSYPEAVRQISYVKQEELEPTIHGVNYYDYNGDLLYVYTPQEFLALSAHPSQPAHAGLVADGWNWELADAQDFIENTCDCLNIGAHYITDTGDTRIYITIPEDDEGFTYWRGLYYRQTVAAGLTVDWGDGTVVSSNNVVTNGTNNSGNTHIEHTYAHAGSYIIKITPQESCIYTLGTGASYEGIFGYAYSTNRMAQANITKVEIGRNVSFEYGNTFRGCCNLLTVSVPSKNNGHFNTVTHGAFLFVATHLKCFVIPEGITAITNNFTNTNSDIVLIFPKTLTAFGGETTGLRNNDSIIFPSGVTTLTQTPIRYCRKTRRIYVPNGVVSFPSYYFAETSSLQELHLPINENFTVFPQVFLCYTGLRYLEIPASITTMNKQCCYSFALEEVIMRPTTPPTAATINIFASSTARLKIYVPYSSDHSILNAYKTTTNWTQFASKIYELDENGNIPND